MKYPTLDNANFERNPKWPPLFSPCPTIEVRIMRHCYGSIENIIDPCEIRYKIRTIRIRLP